MQTIYVDVYFLVNFTVDLLSLHLASLFVKIKISPAKLIFASFFGGAYAVVLVFLPKSTPSFLALTLLTLLIMIQLSAAGCRAVRKIKFMMSFLLAQIIIGGMVYFSYGFLNRILESGGIVESSANKNLLVTSLIILLSIGVLKIMIMLFGNNFSEKNVKVKIVIFEKEYLSEAFVDTGNLATDPMDLSPVMLIKPALAKKIFPYGVPDLSEVHAISEKLKKRVRIIPVKLSGERKTLCGIKADSVSVLKKDGYEKINVTLAFDEEGGSYGGFDILMPATALENL